MTKKTIITIFERVVGTLFTLVLTSMFASALSQRDFRMRKGVFIYLLITMQT